MPIDRTPVEVSTPEISAPDSGGTQPSGIAHAMRVAQAILLLVASVFLALHFVHLSADFPNYTEWRDWSKFTDEGWYGDAAIRHNELGHWNVPGDFNPAAALPVWPLLEIVLFRFTGVSITAARALSVSIFALILLAAYLLLRRAPDAAEPRPRSIAPAICVFLLAVSPFCYAFMRLAILEPLLVLLMLVALLVARAAGNAFLRVELASPDIEVGPRLRRFCVWYIFLLGILFPVMVLTKTTAIFLFPSVLWMLLGSAGYRLRPFLRVAVPAAVIGLALWGAYFGLFVRPYFLEDYQYLYSANAYTGSTLKTFLPNLGDTVYDGIWIGRIVYALALVSVVGSLPSLFSKRLRSPLPAALLLWFFGYAAFMAYHNNMQPRYYLVLAILFTMLVGIVYDQLIHAAIGGAAGGAGQSAHADTILLRLFAGFVTLCLLAAAINGGRHTLHFVLHPAYTYIDAARNIGRDIRRDSVAHPELSLLLLSRSGADLSLMNGIPSICDEFGTTDLPDRIVMYHPGWYAAWNEVEDDKMDDFTPAYRLERVSAYPVMDDPDRNLLVLYRVIPTGAPMAPLPQKQRPGGRILRRLRPKPGDVQTEE
jgi:hypothetical protein